MCLQTGLFLIRNTFLHICIRIFWLPFMIFFQPALNLLDKRLHSEVRRFTQLQLIRDTFFLLCCQMNRISLTVYFLDVFDELECFTVLLFIIAYQSEFFCNIAFCFKSDLCLFLMRLSSECAEFKRIFSPVLKKSQNICLSLLQKFGK